MLEFSRKRSLVWRFFLVLAIAACAAFAHAQTEPALSREMRDQVDRIARQELTSGATPSVSLAIVKDDKIAYVQAYGDARLEPRVGARPEMRYSIGSISKQFTAAAILLLAESGKLSLDDPVSRFVPSLTRASEVTIRQLLSHTSGYQDYWPQDYAPPFILRAVTAEEILDRWARKPLDFDPGTKWQYSNTNYVIAGVIVEKASGMPLLQFLDTKIFAPLGMHHVYNVDQGRLGDSDPTGYMRYALGPPREAPKEGKGWLFAAGELAMTSEDLAKWDISMMEQSLLKPSSYKEMETEVQLKNGAGTGYGLGVGIGSRFGHRMLSHGGEVSGFRASNVVFPDDHAAVLVLTNQDFSDTPAHIARQIAALLFAGGEGGANKKEEQARKIFEGLQRGAIDRSLFTANANSYFNAQAIKDFAASLGPLGAPQEFTATGQQERGGMTFREYKVKFPQKTLTVTIFELPDGKIEQFLVYAAE